MGPNLLSKIPLEVVSTTLAPRAPESRGSKQAGTMRRTSSSISWTSWRYSWSSSGWLAHLWRI